MLQTFLESPNFLQTIAVEVQKNSDAAREVTRGLTEAQLNWKPAPNKWSIAQCLDHLAVTSHEFDSYFADAMARARQKWPVTSPPKYRPSLIGGWLIKQVEPQTGRKLPAPKVFRPATSDIAGALEKFLNQQERFLSFVRNSEGLDYNKARLRSPVTPLMRYSLADAYVVTVVHGQRHLGQARRVRETRGFPD